MGPRLILLGGFLGAGKTTVLGRAAERLRDEGVRVAVVTNDQGSNLVDTALWGVRGLPVAEVPAGCFCCRFDDLLAATDRLTERAAPQVILAEPVGSCTDLAATVLRPLRAMYAERFTLAPLSIAVDATRLLRFIGVEGQGERDDVAYLFAKQLEEADVVLLNKIDLIDTDDLARLRGWLAAILPGPTVLPVSAATGEGLDGWLEVVCGTAQGAPVARRPLDVDYARYGQAEARLGWLNARGTLVGDAGGRAQDWADACLRDLVERLDEHALPIAHVKLHVGGAGGGFLKGSAQGPAPSGVTWDARAPELAARGAHWVLNARVDAAPGALRAAVDATLGRAHAGVGTRVTEEECFQPAPPRPTHRLVAGGGDASP